MKRSKQSQIKIIFIVATILLVLLSIFSYVRINDLIKSSSQLNHTNLVKLELETVFSRVKDADSDQRGFVLTKDSTYLRHFDLTIDNIDRRLKRLDDLTFDNYSQRENRKELVALINKRLDYMRSILKDAPHMKITTERWIGGRRLMTEVRLQVQKMMNEEQMLLQIRTRSLTKETSFTPLFTIFLIISSIIVLIMAYYGINQELRISNALQSDLELRKKDLEEKNESLARMNKELESFTYISSHDLQEPLRKIQTFITRIRDLESAHLSESGKTYLEKTNDSANRMQNLIRDLLAYSRLNVEIFPTEKADLYKIVEQVKADLEEEIANKNALIEVKGNAEVKIIESQFHQLLTNLISNSIKFSLPDRRPHIVVENTLVKGNNVPFENSIVYQSYTKITVTDNGIGFDNEYKNRIFEVFQRLHTIKEFPGTGIGLAIVKKIVENHSGFVMAESQPNVRTVFTIFLPA